MNFRFAADRRIELEGQPIMLYAEHVDPEGVRQTMNMLVFQDQNIDDLEQLFGAFIAGLRREEERCLTL